MVNTSVSEMAKYNNTQGRIGPTQHITIIDYVIVYDEEDNVLYLSKCDPTHQLPRSLSLSSFSSFLSIHM